MWERAELPRCGQLAPGRVQTIVNRALIADATKLTIDERFGASHKLPRAVNWVEANVDQF